MNEQTNKLLQDLANKLGTTAEHLWGVLVKQAPISGLWDCFIIAACLIISMIALSLCFKAFKGDCDVDEHTGRFFLAVALAGASIIFLIAFIVGLFSAGDILAAFLNPEYWALSRIGVVR